MKEIKQTAPKFKIGQVVAIKSMAKEPVFRIIDAIWSDGWSYAWSKRNYAAEHMIRALTKDEIGEIEK